ncbi:ImmA/IrrE family metallo-endopeptidase [Aurantimonas sp. E1-2-R+4]|uniref:ImmA/IrrE family metallo-endopeptidase n=1 Tax=Aurantimonas sp. E1-2-R+4 TaxID=3113714 RepID=UPI002F943226
MGERDKVEAGGDIEVALTDGQEFTPDWFSKPGDSLRALMLRRGLTTKDVAKHLHGGMATLRSLLDGTASVDKPRAAALAEHLGGTVSFWLKRQANYEVALERAVDRAAATEGEDWLLLQVPGEKPRGRLSVEKRRSEVRRRLTFFNVGTLNAWDARYGRICSNTLFRKSETFTADDAATLMWLRMGELGADLVDTRTWSAGNLQDRLDEIRKLSKVKDPGLFLPKLRELCSEAGVAVVAKRAPQGCPASGASRMVAPDKAMILLSFRGLSDDKFWFTVFHEIGHLLLHGACTFVDADMDGVDEVECEANQFASRCIVPERNADEFEQLKPAREEVVRFSVRVGVAPGLTVGQMQHGRMIRQDQLNYLKRRWKWDQLDELLD